MTAHIRQLVRNGSAWISPPRPTTLTRLSRVRRFHWLGARFRHFRGRPKLLVIAALTSTATVLLVLSAFVLWRVNAQPHLGWIELTNSGPPLIAQVLRESSDEPVADPFPVMARSTLALPAGEYRLRVHGVGRLGRTYRFSRQPRRDTDAHSLAR